MALAVGGGHSDGWHQFPAPLIPQNKGSDFSSTAVLWDLISRGKDISPLSLVPTQMKL